MARQARSGLVSYGEERSGMARQVGRGAAWISWASLGKVMQARRRQAWHILARHVCVMQADNGGGN